MLPNSSSTGPPEPLNHISWFEKTIFKSQYVTHSVLALLGFFLPLCYLSFLLSKYPTPTKSGKKYDAMTSTIARNSA